MRIQMGLHVGGCRVINVDMHCKRDSNGVWVLGHSIIQSLSPHGTADNRFSPPRIHLLQDMRVKIALSMKLILTHQVGFTLLSRILLVESYGSFMLENSTSVY